MRRTLSFLCALVLTSTVSAAPPVLPPAPELSLDHVGIQVVDLNRSVSFYTQVLGLREVTAPGPVRPTGQVLAGADEPTIESQAAKPVSPL